jgi:hypothetical protein
MVRIHPRPRSAKKDSAKKNGGETNGNKRAAGKSIERVNEQK